jgi:hypothetical protein
LPGYPTLYQSNTRLTQQIQGHPGAIKMVQAAQDAKALFVSLNSAFAQR